MLIEIIKDTILDSIKLLPFLFLTFLIIELIEHKLTKHLEKIIIKFKRIGPIIGSIFGVIPQCGFSVLATNLYITRIITLGTLISIYLSTSDEMIPIMLSHKTSVSLIFKILLIKVIIGIIFGIIIDLIFKKNKKINYDICEQNNCDCEHNIFLSTLKHTFKTFTFILLATLFINVIFEYLSNNLINKIFLKNTYFAPLLSSLVGLIPSCGSSIILTELFINNTISFSTLISGLLTGSGVAILILFKNNKDIKENIKIVSLLYIIGALVGIIFNILHII